MPYLAAPQVLIDSRYKNVYGGRATTDDEITGLLIAILFAGQHTSSVTSSWTGYRMLSNRRWWEAAREEQRAVVAAHGDKLDMDVLNGMDVLHRNIQVRAAGRGGGPPRRRGRWAGFGPAAAAAVPRPARVLACLLLVQGAALGGGRGDVSVRALRWAAPARVERRAPTRAPCRPAAPAPPRPRRRRCA